MLIEKCTEYLEYRFTADELRDIAEQLARKNTEAAELEERKKQVTSDFAAQVQAAKAEISRLARMYGNKCEYRNIECAKHFDDPQPGRVTIVRAETDEVVRVRQMTTDELQERLPFGPLEPESVTIPEMIIADEILDAMKAAHQQDDAEVTDIEEGFPPIPGEWAPGPEPFVPGTREEVDCTITGPDGNTLFSGITRDLHRAAEVMRQKKMPPAAMCRKCGSRVALVDSVMLEHTPEGRKTHCKANPKDWVETRA